MTTEFVASILASVPMPLVLIDASDRILAMNPKAVDLFGAAAGRPYVTALRQPALSQAIERARRSGHPEQTRYASQGTPQGLVHRVQVSPVGEETGGSVLVAFEDVTDREHAEQMQRDFVANVSHELRSPLTALLGFIETLQGAAQNDAAARQRFLSIMQTEAERMNRLVSDLLSLNRVESAERQRPTGRVELRAIAASTLRTLETVARSRGVRLVLADEAPADVPLTVQGDADQIRQVLINLIENGIKYGGDGGQVTVRLAYSARELALRGPGVLVQVEDAGEGFDPMHIPRLTERFYRVDTHRSREMGGTGLGLAIAKHIVNRHRGRLRIESEPGQGACFTVMLPAIS